MNHQTASNSPKPNSPLVSVIIPAFNISQYISDALDSILSQDFSDYEIIVVNDGSHDTEELERVLKPYQQRIIYLTHEKNKGLSGARNTALRMSRGEYIALLDGDDVWLNNKLSEQVAFIQSDNYDLVYADALLFGDSPWAAGTTFMDKSPSVGEVTLESLLALRCCVVVSTVLGKRQAIVDAGMFDEQVRITEDFDLWVRMALNRNRFGYQRQVLAKYRYRGDSLSANRIKLNEGALRVLNWVKSRNDLNERECEALERTATKLGSRVVLLRAKLMILEGDFSTARQLLSKARKGSNNWKILLALFGLRAAPRLVQKLYTTRETKRAVPENRVVA
jgi:glycosyltransferase involved in cell wall biosynthesis